LDESEKAFRGIISARQDLVLMNRSFMQVGDVLAMKSTLAPKDSTEQAKLQEQALDFYRQVRGKDEVVTAQEARVRYYEEQRRASAGDVGRYKTMSRVVDKEREKLETTKSQPDQALQAKLKSGQMFLAMGRFDEARVLLRFVSNLLGDEEKEEKKKVEYSVVVTYAAQHLAEKAVEEYNKFKTTYPKDSLAENLALLIAGAYLDADPKLNNPETALKYLDEQIATYPTSKYSSAAIIQKAAALIQLKRLPEALNTLQDFYPNDEGRGVACRRRVQCGDCLSRDGPGG
jgi:tetratricopeptide (TPR) repeat protein